MKAIKTAIYNTLEPLSPKTIVIFGLGREGLSTYKFLRRWTEDEKLILVDDRSALDLPQEWDAVKDDPKASFTTSSEFQNYLNSGHLIFVTPGIRPDHQFLQAARAVEAKLHSGTQLFFDIITSHNHIHPNSGKTIAVTGTKGKSTTATAIHHLLKTADKKAFLGGNIGIPALELLDAGDDNTAESQHNEPAYFVMELSAHQLANSVIMPDFAVLLNITPEHLDYYRDFAEYADAKSKITFQQTEQDFLIFNPEYDLVSEIADKSEAKKVTFGGSTDDYLQPDVFVSDNNLFLGQEILASLDELPVRGAHTIENLMPAVCIGKLLEINPEQIRKGLKSFKPLAHRLEQIHQTTKNIVFVDDSLATTPEAAIYALSSFMDQPVILLAGGYDRHLDFDEFAKKIIDANVEFLILFPTTGQKIEAAVKKQNSGQKNIGIFEVKNMEEAVALAMEKARPGSVILLSPGSASFGMFKDYQDRSEQFTAEARKY